MGLLLCSARNMDGRPRILSVACASLHPTEPIVQNSLTTWYDKTAVVFVDFLTLCTVA